MTDKKKKGKILPVFIILIVIAVAAMAAFFLLKPKTAAQAELENILCSIEAAAAESESICYAPLAKKHAELFEIKIDSIQQSFRSADGRVKLSMLDADELCSGLAADMQNLAEDFVRHAKRPSDVYAQDGSFLPEVTQQLYAAALEPRLENADKYILEMSIPVELKYSAEGWLLSSAEDLLSFARMDDAMPGFSGELEPIEFVYKLPDWTSPGPKADSACYGETDDPAEVLALLESDTAKKLINGQELDFDAEKDFIPGTPIRYYLDDSILSIVWQENEHGAVGTFAETFIADASQLRRKLADDRFNSQAFYYPTEFAQQTNGVLTCSGDFYDLPGRVYGLYVYNGELLRSNLQGGQSCLFNDKGDMLFTFENQFSSEQEAQQYIDDNNVMFSLSFGPVLIDKGVDVTPYDYPIGEIRDTYARCAIGQLGERHYLNMTINCLSPDYYVYVTLRQAADSMIEHGCYNAYTLDGGQTGSIVLGGQLINPVQFGYERAQSDCFYFATAIPND